MCAIVGWAGGCTRGQWSQVHRLLTALLHASACRGIDATGFAALDNRLRFIVDKGPLPSRQFAATSAAWKRLASPHCIIAHCRAATHGSPAHSRNNHPFVDSGLAVVVNGIAKNYRKIAEVNLLKLNSKCDSEVVLRLVERERDVATGLEACLDQIEGGMAVAVLDAYHRSVWLARNSLRPTWLLRLKGIRGHFACSTRDIAEEALAHVYGRSSNEHVAMLMPLAVGTVVEMSASGTIIASPREPSGSSTSVAKRSMGTSRRNW